MRLGCVVRRARGTDDRTSAQEQIPGTFLFFERDRSRTNRGEASYGDHFLANVVKADDLRSLAFLKVTTNRLTDFPRQFSQCVRFREDGLPDRARCTRPQEPLLPQRSIHSWASLIKGCLSHMVVSHTSNVQPAKAYRRPSERVGCGVSIRRW